MRLENEANILEVKDSISGKKNKILTPNGIIEIRGNHIKISGDDPACGLWFVGNNTGVKACTFSENKPSTLIAMIPALDKGEYQLKIITQHSRNRILKTPDTILILLFLQFYNN